MILLHLYPYSDIYILLLIILHNPQNHMAEEGNPIVSKHLSALSNDLKVEVKLNSFYLWHVGQTAEGDNAAPAAVVQDSV